MNLQVGQQLRVAKRAIPLKASLEAGPRERLGVHRQLGVGEPGAACRLFRRRGLGGDGFYHVFDRASGRTVVFNGTGPAPAAATPECYSSGIPRIGPLSVSVPGFMYS